METERLRNNINFLRHFVGSKKIAASMFRSLEKQYLSKIDYLGTQKQFLNKLNSLETEKNAAIRENRETIADKKHHIHTNRRKLIYDQRDNKFYTTVFSFMKLILLVLGITVVFLLSKDTQ